MNRQGMTLIEVIIAMAILGILSIMALSIFSGSILGIFHFGDLTEDVFADQELIEQNISDNTTGNASTVQFFFEGEALPITITGQVVDEGELEIFLPD